MKIRMKGNSIRMRLVRSEVDKLFTTGYLEEQVVFPGAIFRYALQSTGAGNELSALLADNKITMLVPRQLINGWQRNNIVGFEATMQVPGNDSLYLLLEKDFVCLDDSTEDQSDHYENPAKTC